MEGNKKTPQDNHKCTCSGNEEMGDYYRMVIFQFGSEIYQVDSCLVNEVKFLLSKGVKTLASCCGHKQTEGFIGVNEESIPIMKSLGYEKQVNPFYPNAEVFFKPKTK